MCFTRLESQLRSKDAFLPLFVSTELCLLLPLSIIAFVSEGDFLHLVDYPSVMWRF